MACRCTNRNPRSSGPAPEAGIREAGIEEADMRAVSPAGTRSVAS
jgi:hypothetical protein